MNKNLNEIVLTFFVLVLSSTSVLGATMSEKFFRKDEPVSVTADKVVYDKNKKLYEASGKVVVKQGSLTLESNSIVMDMMSGFAEAIGEIRITDGEGNIFESTSVEIDLNNELLTSVDARLYFKEDTINFEGAVIRKTGTNRYDGKSMSFTTCDCPESERDNFNPPWSLHTSSAKVRVGGLFTGWNVVFKVKGLPVLYLPFIAAPVVKDRQTGFLAPSFGYSDLKGFHFGTSFFVNLSDSADFTLYYDNDNKKGYGGGVEHRYIRTSKSFGDIYYYNYRERDLDRVRSYRDEPENFNLGRPIVAESDRWELQFHHRESLWGGVVFKANINLISDEEYFLDVGKDSKERAYEMLESNLSFTKAWDRSLFTLEARYFDDLLQVKDEDVYHKMPEAKYSRATSRVFNTPLFWSIQSSLVHFDKEEKAIEGQRLDIKPTLSLPLRPLSFLEVTPSYSPRGTYYFAENSPSEGRDDRYIYEASMDIKSTFVKLWRDASENRNLFTIRPRVKYDYIPDEDQVDFPDYDDVDSIDPLNAITYSLNMTHGALLKDEKKGTTRRHEYLYLDISQSYDVTVASDNLIPRHDREPYSNILLELIVKPTINTKISSKVSFDNYNGWIDTHDAEISYRDDNKNVFAATYKYIRDEQEYAESNIRLHIYGGFGILNKTKYTFYYLDPTLPLPTIHTNETIENMGGLFYKSQCWGVALTYTDKLDEEVTMFSISLKGVGDIGTGASLY